MSRRAVSIASWAVWAAIALAAVGWLALRGPAPPSTFQERVDAVAATLRCPVCRDLSVADSPSELAREMRQLIATKLRAGQTPDEVRSSFVRSYGPWILLSPPSSGLGLVAWLGPAVALLLGAVVVALTIRRFRARAVAAGGRAEAGPRVEGLGDPPLERPSADLLLVDPASAAWSSEDDA